MDPQACERWWTLRREDGPWLHQEVGLRMVERLQWFRQPPRRWLNWEPVHGALAVQRALTERLPEAAWQVWGHDREAVLRATEGPHRPWWARWRAQQGHWADPQQPVDMLWANMVLHHVSDPMPLLRQWHRHLTQEGFLMFSCLGPQTLAELRAVYQAQGWPPPTHDFTDMHDWGDLLVRAGFAEPVVDMERLQLTFSSAEALLAELRTLGRNVHRQRHPGCRGRRWRERLVEAIETLGQRTPDGRLCLSIEVVYGHAQRPLPRPTVAPETAVPLADMRSLLKKGSSRP